MLTRRGIWAVAAGVLLAVTGRLFGVEQFSVLAVAIGATVAAAGVLATSRALRAERNAVVELILPRRQLGLGEDAQLRVEIGGGGDRPLPPLRIGDPLESWTCTHPGIGASLPGDPSPLGHTRPAGSGPGDMAAGMAGADGYNRREGGNPKRWNIPTGISRALKQWRMKSSSLGTAFRLPPLPKGVTVQVLSEVPTETRGVLTLDELDIWAVDPFGLFAQRIGSSAPAHLVVCPALSDDTTVSPGSVRPPLATRGGGDFSGIRPYVPGDRLSLLHWPSLARTGQMAVADFADSDEGTGRIYLDLRREVHDSASLEAAISLAGSLAAGILASGRTLELHTSDGEALRLSPAPEAAMAALGALATLPTMAPAPRLPDLPDLVFSRPPVVLEVYSRNLSRIGTALVVSTTLGRISGDTDAPSAVEPAGIGAGSRSEPPAPAWTSLP